MWIDAALLGLFVVIFVAPFLPFVVAWLGRMIAERRHWCTWGQHIGVDYGGRYYDHWCSRCGRRWSDAR